MSRFSPIRVIQSVFRFFGQILRLARIAAGPASFARLALDHTRARMSYLTGAKLDNRRRTVRLRGGLTITYRLNRGDLQSIREVLAEEVYRVPFDLRPRTLLDLGANIGLSSLWYWRRYGMTKIVAVEADADNAELVRQNLTANGVPAIVIQAAVAASDGTVRFAKHAESNLGSISDDGGGEEIPAVSGATLLNRHWPGGAMVDLVKLDIEGGEKPLLAGDRGWLGRVQALIAEFHFDAEGNRAVAEAIASTGLDYVPAGTAHADSMDFFVRPEARSRLAG